MTVMIPDVKPIAGTSAAVEEGFASIEGDLASVADCGRESRLGNAATRILQLLHSNEAGGVEALARIIGDDLARRGAQVRTHFVYDAFNPGKRGKLRGIAKTIKRLRRERPDVVVAYQSTASVLAGVFGRAFGIPVRIVHQTAMPGEVHPLMRHLDRLAGIAGLYSVNIVNSLATKSAFAQYPPRYRKSVMLIEHGIAPPDATRQRAATLARHGIPDSDLVLFNAGRLSEQKAQDIVIRALAQLPSAQLVIAGGGPRQTEYADLARSLGVSERLHMLGYVDREEVGNLLAASDVFVFPSRWETFGLAPVEAAMTGMPVVASALDVLREVLRADENSPVTFVAGNDPALWAEGIRSAYSQREAAEERNRLAARLRDIYSETRMLDRYAVLVAELLERVRGRS